MALRFEPLALVLFAGVCGAAGACTSSSGNAAAPEDSGADANPFDASLGDDGGGDGGFPNQGTPDVSLTPAYPPGPYGTDVGSVIPDLKLVGFPAPASALVPLSIALDDFYNPTGHGSFPAGSPYGTDALPQALVIDVAALWCEPCDLEAKTDLSWRWSAMHPAGEILTILLEGQPPGTPATNTNLTSWVQAYQAQYPAALDPSRASEGIVADAGGGIFPTNLLVRTTDMKIVAISKGIPDASFWQAVEALLPGDADLVGEAGLFDDAAPASDAWTASDAAPASDAGTAGDATSD